MAEDPQKQATRSDKSHTPTSDGHVYSSRELADTRQSITHYLSAKSIMELLAFFLKRISNAADQTRLLYS